MNFDTIFMAAKSDDFDKVASYLEENNVDELNEVGLSGLHVCASSGSLDSAVQFLKHGASVFLSDRESHWTALHRSLYNHHVKLSILLLKCGAQLDCERSTDSQMVDKDNLTPMDLLSTILSKNLAISESNLQSSSVVSFGKADFQLGVPLPKASAVVEPRRIDTLTESCITQVCASRYHSCALTKDGEVYTWGHGRGGRLGHGNEVSQPEPARIDSLLMQRVLVKQLASGENHTIAVSRHGDVYTWGSDRFGQLGHGNATYHNGTSTGESTKDEPTASLSKENVFAPRRVEALRRDSVLAVAAGDAHSLCHTREGVLYAWGSNSSGQLGLRPTELIALPGGGLGASLPKRLFIEALNRVRSAGSAGATGTTARPGRIVQIAASHNNTMLLCKEFTSMATSTAGSVNGIYQWGHGLFTPVRVTFKDRKSRSFSIEREPMMKNSVVESRFIPVGHSAMLNIVQVAPGQHHFAALSADGSVYTWHTSQKNAASSTSSTSSSSSSAAGAGAAMAGVVPLGPKARMEERVDERVSDVKTSLSSPSLVTGMLTEHGGGWVTSIAATCNRTLAVTNVGNLYSWPVSIPRTATTAGEKSSASEPTTLNSVPHRIAHVKRAVAVSAGADHTLCVCAYTLPVLPLAACDMFADRCPQTGELLSEAAEKAAGGHNDDNDDNDSDDDRDEEERMDQTEEYPSDQALASDPSSMLQESMVSLRKVEASYEESKEDGSEEDAESGGAIPSLQALCQRAVARTINIKTAVAALSFAEQFCAGLLVDYCTQYIQLNFDAVLTLTKPVDFDRYVDSWGYGSLVGKPRTNSTLGAAPAPRSPTKGRATTATSGMKSTDKSTIGRAMLGSLEGAAKTTIKSTSQKGTPSTTEEVQKQMRGVKKKLSGIKELEEKLRDIAGFVLSAEQQDKMTRKAELYVEQAHLEQMLVRCEARERIATATATAITPTTNTNTPPPALAPVMVAVSPMKGKAPTTVEKIYGETSPASAPTSTTTKTTKKGKVKGISLQEFNSRLESATKTTPPDFSSRGKASSAGPVWGAKKNDNNANVSAASVDAAAHPLRMELPSAAPTLPVTMPLTQGKRINPSPQEPLVKSVVTPARAPPTPPTPTTTPRTPPPLPAAPVLQVAGVDSAGPRRTRALLDFLPPSVQGGVAPPITASPAKATWSTTRPQASPQPATATTPVASTGTGTGTGAAKVSAASPLSFSDIQRAEERARKESTLTSLQGNSIPWYVERRQRADSMEEVLRQQAWDREEEEEIARAVAEIDRLTLANSTHNQSKQASVIQRNAKSNFNSHSSSKKQKAPTPKKATPAK